jgi:hypothetical protein
MSKERGTVMIPRNIKRECILKALEEIEREGIPKARDSKRFYLEYNGKRYPPKYAVSLANKYASGVELDSSEFSGGSESNDFLRKLGFNIVEIPSLEKVVSTNRVKERRISSEESIHDERCPKCKETIRKMLEKIYDKVETNYRFEIGTSPQDFMNTLHYRALKNILNLLQDYREFKEFVKAKTLPHCDFFIPNPGFILEFDESQHFTIPRKIALEQYPENLQLGFDKQRWTSLCEEINARDNDPPYRDEQRAWYDTLRDFLPAMIGLKPTIRLFARDSVWCSLNPDDPSDIKKFESILKGEIARWKIEVREDSNPFLARIILAGSWEGKPEKARKLLEDIYENWPKGKKVKFIITCGGFIQFNWPKSVSRWDIGDNKNPYDKAVDALVKEAEKCARHVLSNGLNEKLRELTDYITLGIDSYKEKISTTKNYIGQLHVELVFLIDFRNNNFYWTGKSYPTSNQQNGLVRIPDFKTHFLDLDAGKLMILGCHDLTIFNPRSKNAKGWRKEVNEEFQKLAKEKKPTIVLQHPHTTDSILTWAAAWNGLKEALPSVKICVSAGKYWYEGKQQRSKLNDVLEKTKAGNTIDFVVRMNMEE